MGFILKRDLGLKPGILESNYPTLKHGLIIDSFRIEVHPLPRPLGRGQTLLQKRGVLTP